MRHGPSYQATNSWLNAYMYFSLYSSMNTFIHSYTMAGERTTQLFNALAGRYRVLAILPSRRLDIHDSVSLFYTGTHFLHRNGVLQRTNGTAYFACDLFQLSKVTHGIAYAYPSVHP